MCERFLLKQRHLDCWSRWEEHEGKIIARRAAVRTRSAWLLVIHQPKLKCHSVDCNCFPIGATQLYLLSPLGLKATGLLQWKKKMFRELVFFGGGGKQHLWGLGTFMVLRQNVGDNELNCTYLTILFFQLNLGVIHPCWGTPSTSSLCHIFYMQYTWYGVFLLEMKWSFTLCLEALAEVNWSFEGKLYSMWCGTISSKCVCVCNLFNAGSPCRCLLILLPFAYMQSGWVIGGGCELAWGGMHTVGVSLSQVARNLQPTSWWGW